MKIKIEYHFFDQCNFTCPYLNLGLFFRTVQEKLDWEKLGLPDLRSLLVQLGDKIILKKDKYTGDKYVFVSAEK